MHMKKFSLFAFGVLFLSSFGLNHAQAQVFDPELVMDIYEGESTWGGIASSYPTEFTEYNGVLYFNATDENGAELWKYDGVNDPEMVIDLYPGDTDWGDPNGSYPNYLTVYNDLLYFTATTEEFGGELWSYDGVNDPVLVSDIFPGTSTWGDANSSYPSYLTVYNDKLYFSANANDLYENELWSYDGSDVEEIDVNDGPGSSYPSNMFVHTDGSMYFSAEDGELGAELWRLTGDEIEMLPEIYLGPSTWGGPGSSYPSNFVSFQDELYFSAEGADGNELYKYDGVNDPEMVMDISPGMSTWGGANSSYPGFLTVFNDKLFFTAEDATYNNEIYVYDGVSDPEVAFEVNATNASYPSYLTVLGGYMFFNADDGVNGAELWQYDDINDAEMVEDIYAGEFLSSYPSNLYVFQGSLYFSADDGDTGAELWKMQGELYIGSVEDQILCNGLTFEEDVFVIDPQGAEVTLTLSSSDTDIIPDENLSYSGEFPNIIIEVITVTGQTGDVTITMTATTDEDEKGSSFVVTVVDDCSPVFGDLPSSVTTCDSNEYGSLAFDVVDPNQGDITVTAVSSDTDLLPNENITVEAGIGGQFHLSFDPIAETQGDVTITLTADNGETTDATIDFTIIDCTPVIEGLPTEAVILCTDEGLPETVDFTVIDPLADIEIEITSTNTILLNPSNVNLEEDEDGFHLSMSAPFGVGTVTVSVIADNGEEVTVETFDVSIGSCAPNIIEISDLSLCHDDIFPVISTQISDNSGEEMVLTIESSNELLIPEVLISYIGSVPYFDIYMDFVDGITGESTITVTAFNGTYYDVETFLVTVDDCGLGLNAPADGAFCDDDVYVVEFTVPNGDSNVNVTAVSNNQTVIPDDNIQVVGAGEFYTFAADNVVGETGIVEITVTVTKFSQTFSDKFLLDVNACVGLDEEGLNSVSLSPNPGNGQFAINGLSENTQIEIRNSLGQLVSNLQANADVEYIDLDLQAGMYYVRLIHEDQTRVMKYIVK